MNKDFQKLLSEFVSIPSVSADVAYKNSIEKASQWVASFAKRSGMQVKVIKGFDNPIVIARTKRNPRSQTILVYGHYDVQPAKKEDGWKTEPFTLTKKGGKLYGRGSTDNKGQILTHLYSTAKLIQERKLGYNVIFMVEGNEETGSPNLKRFIEKNKKDLACDCVIISDGELGRRNSPALEASFRGVINLEISMRTAKDDMHSGLFGGAVPNAAEELSRLISKFHDENKRILVPGFYGNKGKKKEILNKKEQDGLKLITGSEKVFANNNSQYEWRTGLEPAIEVTSFVSGYLGVGFRNSIPSYASAKINIRTVSDQNQDKILTAFKQFVSKNVPSYVTLKIKSDEASPGASLQTKNEFARRASKILKNIYREEPVEKHSGGTLPIVNNFKNILNVPQVMIPLANEDCGMHSASENITIDSLEKGLAFSYKFFSTN